MTADEDLHERLVAAADDRPPCQRVLRHVEDRQVATVADDFYAALKHVDGLVVRLRGATAASVPVQADYRYTNGYVEYTTSADLDPELTGRENFTQAVRVADSVRVLPDSESWFTDAGVSPEYQARIEEPRGYPDGIEGDHGRADAPEADRTRIDATEDRVIVAAEDDEAADWLYQWLEDTVTHYREEYVDATMEHDAARQLRDVVYRQFIQAGEESEREIRADGGQSKDVTPQWEEQADENIEKWGQQPLAELALALAEELGEVCDVLLNHCEAGDGGPPVGDYDDRSHRGRHLLAEQRDLGFEIRDYLEDAFEDEDGNPIPVEERPAIAGELRTPDALRDELDDLGALAVQMDRGVSEQSRTEPDRDIQPDDDLVECIACGDEIPEGDAVHGAGDVDDEALDEVDYGESVPLLEVFAFDDGPYCALDCLTGEAGSDD